MLAEADNLRRGLEEIDKGLGGRLRIGAIPTALPIVSQITGPFTAKFPGVSFAVLSLTSQEIERRIEDFELDVGPHLPRCGADRAGQGEADLRRGIRVPDAFRIGFLRPNAIAWSEAARAPLCLLTPDMQNRRIIDGVFRSVGEKPDPAVETNSIFNLVSHVGCRPMVGDRPAATPAFLRAPAWDAGDRTRRADSAPNHRPRDERPRAALPARPQPVRDAMAGRHRSPDRAARPRTGTTSIGFTYRPVQSSICRNTFDTPSLVRSWEERLWPHVRRSILSLCVG